MDERFDDWRSLAGRQIPYQVVGTGSYYDRMEVKDVLAMLQQLNVIPPVS